MQAFYQHVGEVGSERDFPRSLFNAAGGLRHFQVSDVSNSLPLSINEIVKLDSTCRSAAPLGFQIWGVPAPARSIMRQVEVGDAFLLLRTIGPEGRFGYAGRVIAIPQCDGTELSRRLWGEPRFPLVIFLDGGPSVLPWAEFCSGVGYKANLNPRGQTARINPEKLTASTYGSASKLLSSARGTQKPYSEAVPSWHDEAVQSRSSEDESLEDLDLAAVASPEGRKILRLHLQRERDPKLVALFKRQLRDWKCVVCGFDFEAKYGLIGRGFIEVHHTRPLAGMAEGETTELRSLVAVCSNCHRMLHRQAPPLAIDQLRSDLK